MIRAYSELIKLQTFEDRFRYLSAHANVGDITFGGSRYLNQDFYRSREWKRVRDIVIIRDSIDGVPCDLGCADHPIFGKVLIHHLCPLTIRDFRDRSPYLLDPEYLILVSHQTHNAIHYGDISKLPKDYVPRSKNDTCPWR